MRALAKIKRMWGRALSPWSPALGLGSCNDLEDLARERRLPLLRLETNQAPDRGPSSLYRRNGFREVAAFNDEPYAHHWFEKTL